MAKFRYTAIDAGGKTLRGIAEADTALIVADRLHRQGQHLVRADELGRHGRFLDFLQADIAIERGLPKKVVAHFTRELSVMLTAGQDIDHALRFLVESTTEKRAHKILESVRNDVRNGKALAAALSEHPKVFSRLYVSLVRAGEAGGNLAESLEHLADLMEREVKLAQTVQSAMIYPALLTLVAIATVVMLLTYVLPQFKPIFEQAGGKLPAPTRAMIAIGDFIGADGLWMLMLLILIAAAFYRAMREPGPRMAVERVLLRIPVVGTLIRRIQTARLMRTLGTLLGNGVSLVSALAIGRGVLSNLVAAGVVERAANEVRSGARLAAALGRDKFFPIQCIHLIQLGEETGKLSQMALRSAEIYDDQVRTSVERLVALLVPFVTITMGIFVAGIIASLLLAMLSLNDLVV